MPNKSQPPVGENLLYLQENIRRAGPAASAGYALIGSILLFGGIGYLIDWWQDTTPWCFIVGLFLGVVIGFYELSKTVWKR